MKRVRMETANWLSGYVHPRRLRQFWGTLLTPSERTLLFHHDQWMAATGRRLVRTSGWAPTSSEERPRWFRIAKSKVGAARARELTQLERRIRRLLRTSPRGVLAQSAPAGEGDRALIAWLRVLEPLLASADAGYVERGWRELSDRELKAFVKAGLRRERILLNRAPRLDRVRRVSDRGAAPA
jgi:hypothetical protein